MTPVEAKNFFEKEFSAFCQQRYAGQDGIYPAIRYALMGGGKRVRPIMCLLVAETMGARYEDALTASIALEMVHTYSLVHDDLPCMDDDALRRGRPSTHIEYGEAFALLVGDALLTDAFEMLAELPNGARMVKELAAASGSQGMVQGQALDLYWTGRESQTRDILDKIHQLKTGRLLGAACALGAISANADQTNVLTWRSFGQEVGLAFQICDDLLDEEAGTGKSQGKDKQTGKLTYLALMSRAQANQVACEVTDSAMAKLDRYGLAADHLRVFVKYLLRRQN